MLRAAAAGLLRSVGNITCGLGASGPCLGDVFAAQPTLLRFRGSVARHPTFTPSKPVPNLTGKVKVTQFVRGSEITLTVSGTSPENCSLQREKRARTYPDQQLTAKYKPGGGEERSAAAQLVSGYLAHATRQLQAFILPSGYPTSVGSNYMQYTLWQAVTNVATTANGVLASTFLLYSVGLGAGAIPTAGALNWVLKDGLGQIGTLLFGKAIAHNFDIHSKSWYFLSFVLLSTATGLEIATILVPQAFLVLGSCANMIKGLSWMAGGSTRSVFNLSFVRDNNIADITAKNTSQYIFASLFGTAAGVSLCAYIGQSAGLALTCFGVLTVTSLLSAYRTVKSIPLPTLNGVRLQLLAIKYLRCVRVGAQQEQEQQEEEPEEEEEEPEPTSLAARLRIPLMKGIVNFQRLYKVPDEDDTTCELNLPNPLELADIDPPLPWLAGDQNILNPEIRVGAPIEKLLGDSPGLLMVLVNTFRYSRYMLLPGRNVVHLVLHVEAAPRDIVQAYLQACIVRRRMRLGADVSPGNLPELRILLHDTLLAAEKLTPHFMRALARRSWQTEKIVVEAHRRRARW